MTFLVPTFALLAGGCASRTDSTDDLFVPEHEIVAGTAASVIDEALWVSSTTGEDAAAFALSLLGTRNPYTGRTSAHTTCDVPFQTDLLCEVAADLDDAELCTKIGCLDGGVRYTETAVSPTGGGELSYSSDLGVVRYPNGTTRRWTADSGADGWALATELGSVALVEIDLHDTINATLTGNVAARLEDQIPVVSLTLHFTGLSDEGDLIVAAETNDDGRLGGTVTLGQDPLATLSRDLTDPLAELEVAWTSDLAPGCPPQARCVEP